MLGTLRVKSNPFCCKLQGSAGLKTRSSLNGLRVALVAVVGLVVGLVVAVIVIQVGRVVGRVVAVVGLVVGRVVGCVVGLVVGVGVVGVWFGSHTMLPPQELHNKRRDLLESVHLLERALHFLLDDQYQ